MKIYRFVEQVLALALLCLCSCTFAFAQANNTSLIPRTAGTSLAGQVVGTGQVIGYEGTTGFSTGCHLHFATNINGIWENPRYLLP